MPVNGGWHLEFVFQVDGERIADSGSNHGTRVGTVVSVAEPVVRLFERPGRQFNAHVIGSRVEIRGGDGLKCLCPLRKGHARCVLESLHPADSKTANNRQAGIRIIAQPPSLTRLVDSNDALSPVRVERPDRAAERVRLACQFDSKLCWLVHFCCGMRRLSLTTSIARWWGTMWLPAASAKTRANANQPDPLGRVRARLH